MKRLRQAAPFAVGVAGAIIDGHAFGPFFWFGLACYIVGAVVAVENLSADGMIVDPEATP